MTDYVSLTSMEFNQEPSPIQRSGFDPLSLLFSKLGLTGSPQAVRRDQQPPQRAASVALGVEEGHHPVASEAAVAEEVLGLLPMASEVVVEEERGN